MLSLKWLEQMHGVKWLVAFLISLSFIQAQEAQAYIDKSFSDPIDLGTPIENVALFDGSFGVEGGRDVVYTTAAGDPAIFQVADLKSRELLRSFELEGSESSWAHVTLPDGSVYIGGNGSLYKYSPETHEVENLGGIGESVVYGLSYDEQGRVYFGSYPNAKAGRYDPATGEMKDYGTMSPGQSYSRATAYLDGYLYVGIGIQGSLVKLDVETGVKETIELPTYGGAVDLAQVYQLDAAGQYIVAGLGDGNRALLFYDTKTQQWSDIYYLNNKGIRLAHGLPDSNKAYFVQNNHLMELDVATLSATDTGVVYGTYIRNAAWVQAPDQESGLSLATISWGGGVAFMNLETGTVQTYDYPFEGSPIPIQTLEKGPDGKLYMSGYPGGRGAIYDPQTGSFENFGLGQSEGMVGLGDKMYFGNYSGAHILELDIDEPIQAGTNPKEIFSIPKQDRPFKMIAGEGKLFIGTIPDYGELGGSLTVYDPQSVSGPEIYEDVVHHQSIVGLAYRDGKLYGSTTIHGGLGISPTEAAAKMFVWDVATGTKLKDWTPELPGVSNPALIGSIDFGPDGLLWAVADGTVFAVDPDTTEIVKSKTIYPGVSNYSRWRPMQLRWSDDGLLYTTLSGKVTVIDPETLEHATLSTPGTQLMTLGDDGHLYLAGGTHLYQVQVAEGDGTIPIRIELPLDNGSFDEAYIDEDIPGWSSMFEVTDHVSYEVSSEQALTAPHSLKLIDEATTETVAVMSDAFPVTPGVEYTAGVSAYLQEGRALATMQFFDALGKQVGSEAVQITSGTGKWNHFEWSKEAPEGAVNGRLVFFISNYWMATVFYDDATVSYIADVTEEDLAPSFTLQAPAVVSKDQTFTVSLHYSSGTEFYAAHAKLQYDAAKLQLVEATAGSAFHSDQSGFFQVNTDHSVGSIRLVASKINDYTVQGSGSVAEMTFKALADSGSTSITLSQQSEWAAPDADETMELHLLPAEVTVVVEMTSMPEDVNQDGKVNLADLVAIAKKLQAAVTDETERMDVNRDGQIDITDVSLVAHRLFQ